MQPEFIPLTFVTFENNERVFTVSEGIKAGKSTLEEAKKFEKFKRRKPREKLREEKKRKFQLRTP